MKRFQTDPLPKTTFTLTTAVHHLDVLTLAYTAPGSDPTIRDTATPAGNAAANGSLDNGSITNSTTNMAPRTPTLVSPTSGKRLSTSTPTLTATFSDPDPNDTGTVSFQVCSTSDCTTVLASFDSSSNTANSSAPIPAGTITTDGTYYWRAKNTDSSAKPSAFTGTRSFIIDTSSPSAPVLVSPSNGATVTTHTPTLIATFSDPDAGDTGKITFQLCSNSDCSSVIGNYDSGNTSNNHNASVVAPTLSNGTYYWRAMSTDNAGNTSSYSGIRSFIVNAP